jgi:hypothetical protein
VLQNEANIKTVTKEEAILFLKNQNTSLSTSSKSTNFNIDFDFEKLTQEKLTNSSELLTVVPIITKIKNQRSRALILRVVSTVESMIYNEFPDATSSKNSFDGIIIMTKLNGDFIRAYRLKANEYVHELAASKKSKADKNKAPNNGNERGIELDEVIVTNSYKNSSTFVSLNEMGKEVPISVSWDSMGGGGGTPNDEPVTNVEQDLPTPCLDLKNLIDYNFNTTNSLKSSINWLEDKVNATVNNKEAGVEVKKMMNPDETFRYEFTQVLSNEQFSVLLSIGSSYVGGLHSHPSDGYAMFSFQDIRFLLNVYDEASSTRKGAVFNGLVCKDNAGNTNTYMLKIDNIDALRKQVDAVWNNSKYLKFQKEDLRIKAIHNNQARKYKNSNGNLEKSFIEQFKDFGISLYKADAITNSFDKLTLNNSIVTPTPCN